MASRRRQQALQAAAKAKFSWDVAVARYLDSVELA